MGMMFLLVSVVYSTWHLGLGVIGPHSHLEKTGEWRSLGTLLLEKDTKSLKRLLDSSSRHPSYGTRI